MKTDKMIELDPEAYIAKGNGSFVFVAPYDQGILLKVPVEKRPSRLRRRLTSYLRPSKRRFGMFREWQTEYDEYIAAIHKTGALPRCLPQLHGFVQTNLGPAFAVEKITDENTTDIALTIENYVKNNDPATLQPALDKFFEEVQTSRIVFFDMKLYNLCVVRDASGAPVRVVAIDSIGENTVIKVRRWSRKLYDMWLSKTRADFMDRVMKSSTG